jgi:hypothetical protein
MLYARSMHGLVPLCVRGATISILRPIIRSYSCRYILYRICKVNRKKSPSLNGAKVVSEENKQQSLYRQERHYTRELCGREKSEMREVKAQRNMSGVNEQDPGGRRLQRTASPR